MKHASLFSGIGGFDLAAEWMGWDNVLHCEINQFCQRILKYYWPNTISYGDIKTTDFTIHRGGIDILTGGFPCQPYSTAGKRKGTEDDRHLWPEMLRAIREIQPSWIVGENVPGLINWNDGVVFEQVQADLENEGYEVQPFVLPACGVDAPHRRDRVWIVAYSAIFRERSRATESGSNNSFGKFMEGSKDRRYNNNDGESRITTYSKSSGFGSNNNLGKTGGSKEETEGEEYWKERNEVQREWDGDKPGRIMSTRDITHSNVFGLEGIERNPQGEFSAYRNPWSEFPTQSPICIGNDVISSRLDFATVFEGIPFSRKPIPFGKWRNESIKGAGNAVAPHLVFQIFKAIEEFIKQECVTTSP